MSENDSKTRSRNHPIYRTDRYSIAVYAPTRHDSDGDGTPCSRCGRQHDKPSGYPSFRIVWYDHLTERTPRQRRTEAAGKSERAATRRANEIERLLTEYGSVAAAERAALRLVDLAEIYQRDESRPANVSWSACHVDNTERYCRIHIVPLLGDVKASDLTHEHAKQLVGALRRKGLAAGTIFNVCVAFVGIVKLAAAQGYIRSADAIIKDHTGRSFVPSGVETKVQGVTARLVRREGIPTLHVIEEMRSAMERLVTKKYGSDYGWSLGYLVDFLAHTGCRSGEALALTRSDVQWSTDEHGNPVIRIQVLRQVGREPRPQATTLPKCGKQRFTLYLGDAGELQRLLYLSEAATVAGRNPHELLFPYSSNAYDHYYTTHRVRALGGRRRRRSAGSTPIGPS